MVVTEIMAFLRALPELVSLMRDLNSSINNLRADILNKKLEEFKGEVTKELDTIILAKNDTDRRNGIVALSKRLASKRL